eukprot:SAG11_NODE_3768_length_2237_cov_7.517774_1_plen_459_part_10
MDPTSPTMSQPETDAELISKSQDLTTSQGEKLQRRADQFGRQQRLVADLEAVASVAADDDEDGEGAQELFDKEARLSRRYSHSETAAQNPALVGQNSVHTATAAAAVPAAAPSGALPQRQRGRGRNTASQPAQFGTPASTPGAAGSMPDSAALASRARAKLFGMGFKTQLPDDEALRMLGMLSCSSSLPGSPGLSFSEPGSGSGRTGGMLDQSPTEHSMSRTGGNMDQSSVVGASVDSIARPGTLAADSSAARASISGAAVPTSERERGANSASKVDATRSVQPERQTSAKLPEINLLIDEHGSAAFKIFTKHKNTSTNLAKLREAHAAFEAASADPTKKDPKLDSWLRVRVPTIRGEDDAIIATANSSLKVKYRETQLLVLQQAILVKAADITAFENELSKIRITFSEQLTTVLTDVFDSEQEQRNVIADAMSRYDKRVKTKQTRRNVSTNFKSLRDS